MPWVSYDLTLLPVCTAIPLTYNNLSTPPRQIQRRHGTALPICGKNILTFTGTSDITQAVLLLMPVLAVWHEFCSRIIGDRIMSVPRAVVFVCLLSVLLAAAGWATAPPVVDQIAAAMSLPDGADAVLDAVYVENVIGGYISVRDWRAHSQDLLVSTDAAVQANWTVKVTGQMTTIDGQRVLIADSVQLYVTIDGSPAPPIPPCLLVGMAGISLVDIPAMPAQRGSAFPQMPTRRPASQRRGGQHSFGKALWRHRHCDRQGRHGDVPRQQRRG